MNCPNCNKYVVPSAPYCGHCGQKTTLNDEFKLVTVLGQFFGSIFSVDSKVLKTLIVLFIPGRFYKDFVSGKRERYMHPLRLFIFFNLFLFGLLISFNSESDANKDNKFFPGSLTWGDQTIDSLSLQNSSVEELMKQYPPDEGFIGNLTFKQLLHLHKDEGEYLDYVKNKLPWVLFIFIPLMALASFLLEFKKREVYLKHFLFWTNVISAVIFVNAFELVLFKLIGINEKYGINLAAMLFFPVFSLWSLQRVYPTKRIFLRVLKWPLYVLMSVLIFAISFISILIISFLFF